MTNLKLSNIKNVVACISIKFDSNSPSSIVTWSWTVKNDRSGFGNVSYLPVSVNCTHSGVAPRAISIDAAPPCEDQSQVRRSQHRSPSEVLLPPFLLLFVSPIRFSFFTNRSQSVSSDSSFQDLKWVALANWNFCFCYLKLVEMSEVKS